MKLMEKIRKNENGQVLVVVALMMVVLISFAALIIDVGAMYLTKTNMQNAADSAAIAGAQALPNATNAINAAKNYAELNGAEKVNTTVTTPYKGDSNMIEVVCTKDVQFSFAGVLGFINRNVSARAVAEKSGMEKGPFDFTIFSGDPNKTLSMNGSNTTINGSAHSNYKFSINGANQLITGNAEAVSAFTMNGSHQTISGSVQASKITTNGGNIKIGEEIEIAASWIDMPDFSDMIQAEAEAAGQVYIGNKTYNGGYLDVDSPIYIDGNLTVNGSHFTGTGVVLVSGNITFNGSNLRSSGASVCFYSENGDITINGAHAELDGLVYAPKGTIRMNGSHQTVNGRVIGNAVTFNGSDYNFTAGADDLDSLPKSGVTLVE